MSTGGSVVPDGSPCTWLNFADSVLVPYLFVLLVGLLCDLLGLSELRLERRRPVVLHVGLVLQGLAYPELGGRESQTMLVKGKTQQLGQSCQRS